MTFKCKQIHTRAVSVTTLRGWLNMNTSPGRLIIIAKSAGDFLCHAKCELLSTISSPRTFSHSQQFVCQQQDAFFRLYLAARNAPSSRRQCIEQNVSLLIVLVRQNGICSHGVVIVLFIACLLWWEHHKFCEYVLLKIIIGKNISMKRDADDETR